MPLLSRKSILAIGVVTDIGCNGRAEPVTAKMLTGRYGLTPRHLEPLLQCLVREGILNGKRGPRGGYFLGREPHLISVDDILRAAGTLDESADQSIPASPLLS